MARFSVNELTTFRWRFEEDVARYRAAGINAIGVWRDKLSDFGEEKGIELLAESGLAVSNLLWAGGFTGSDGRSCSESVSDAAEAITLAAAMRCPTLVVYSGARGGHTLKHARRLLTDALDELLPLALQQQVTLALEPMYPGCADDCTFLTDLDDALSLVESIGSPRLKLVFDTYHLCHDPAWIQRAEQIVPHVAVVHLADGRQPPHGEQDRCRLGEGNLPLAETIAALTAAGYDGYFDVELIGEQFEAADYQELLRHSKLAFEQLVNLAAAK